MWNSKNPHKILNGRLHVEKSLLPYEIFIICCTSFHAWRWNKVLVQHLITSEWGFCQSCEFVGVLTMYTNVTTTWCVMANAEDKSIESVELLRRQEIGVPYIQSTVETQMSVWCVKLSIVKTMHHCSKSIANWKSDSPYVFNRFPVYLWYSRSYQQAMKYMAVSRQQKKT